MENEWISYIRDGDRYLKAAAEGARRRKSVFIPEILYNIVSMAIEKHIMGYLLFHNRMPDNHTLADLAEAVGAIESFDDELIRRMVRMDRFQRICALSDYFRQQPSEDDVGEFLEIGQLVRNSVAELLPEIPDN